MPSQRNHRATAKASGAEGSQKNLGRDHSRLSSTRRIRLSAWSSCSTNHRRHNHDRCVARPLLYRCKHLTADPGTAAVAAAPCGHADNGEGGDEVAAASPVAEAPPLTAPPEEAAPPLIPEPVPPVVPAWVPPIAPEPVCANAEDAPVRSIALTSIAETNLRCMELSALALQAGPGSI